VPCGDRSDVEGETVHFRHVARRMGGQQMEEKILWFSLEAEVAFHIV
jgi:hypothetical protein